MNLFEYIHEKYLFGRRIRVLCERLAECIPPDATLLDVGCGDGSLALRIMQMRPDITIRGIDVLIRDKVHIPVELFDSTQFPYDDNHFDAVMFVDVLHHTDDPEHLLREAARVARKNVIIKDHLLNGLLAGPTLRLMDHVGNARHGVTLIYNFWSRKRWQQTFQSLGLSTATWNERLHIYPWPIGLIFDRTLHFIASLSLPENRQTDHHAP